MNDPETAIDVAVDAVGYAMSTNRTERISIDN